MQANTALRRPTAEQFTGWNPTRDDAWRCRHRRLLETSATRVSVRNVPTLGPRGMVPRMPGPREMLPDLEIAVHADCKEPWHWLIPHPPGLPRAHRRHSPHSPP